ncbi:DsbC family protein [Marinospirillum perlucidum]|uniref:DsbC family protein n=1 Tax=Marinospirillum perlucidum TaxID=1982602 RepID=UPI0013905B49|nr:DsbC family protein [Marinospirillum perlucidum]
MRILQVIWASLVLSLALAASAQAAQPDQSFIEQQLQTIDPRIAIESLESTPVEGVFEVLLNSGDLVYVSEDGEHLFAGSLLALNDDGVTDLTENKRSQLRRSQLQAIPAEEQVVFPAEGETRAIVQVFTDITCPYCRRLHGEVPELNAAGVEVRYLGFPRQGLQSDGHQQLVNVWCADDRAEAMTLAKSGENLPAADCETPIAEQYQLARSQGIQGTPAIILPEGRIIPGYVPAARLLSELGL